MFTVCTNLIVTMMLTAFTVQDLRRHTISRMAAAACASAGLILRLVFAQPLAAGLAGALPGLLLLLISRACGEAIGRGDCYTLSACGAALGPAPACEMFFIALLFAAAWSVVLIVRERNGKQRFAFMPFMLAGQICMLLSR